MLLDLAKDLMRRHVSAVGERNGDVDQRLQQLVLIDRTQGLLCPVGRDQVQGALGSVSDRMSLSIATVDSD